MVLSYESLKVLYFDFNLPSARIPLSSNLLYVFIRLSHIYTFLLVFPVFRINADWILSSLLRDEDCICSVLLFKDQLAIDIRHLRFVTKHQVLYRYWNNFRSYLKEKYYHAPGES